MFVINVSIDKIDTLHQIAAIRINPNKYTPSPGDLCTYEWGTLDNKDRFFQLGKFRHKYDKNNLDFATMLLGKYQAYMKDKDL